MRGPDDGRVQLRVRRDLLQVRLEVSERGGVVARIGLELRRELLQATDLGRGRAVGGDLRGLRLDHQADLVELLDVTDRDRGYDRAAAWRHRDESFGGHLVHGVADRRDADAERCGDLGRRDPFAGLELAAKDAPEQPIVDLRPGAI